jgi:neurofibromin 1
MNLMNDCNDAQEVEKDLTRQRMSAGKLTTLRNVTIQAMSNLLSANIDSGLMHSIGKY